jgi:hypothetical protein
MQTIKHEGGGVPLPEAYTRSRMPQGQLAFPSPSSTPDDGGGGMGGGTTAGSGGGSPGIAMPARGAVPGSPMDVGGTASAPAPMLLWARSAAMVAAPRGGGS